MAPPPLPTRHYGPTITSQKVTEDTPPDLLEGTMDLHVTLPSGKAIIMNVHRSTPMMDLLVQVTTAHRINPGGHIIQVVSDNIFLSYKPSTPIGQLDTSAIKIVPKNKLKDAAKVRKSNLQQQSIERNIRLKPEEWVFKQKLLVNLPKNQLAVYRVPPRTLISDILSMVCKDKNLDEESYEIRHPVNVDERLRGSCSLFDYQLQEVCVVSRDFRPPPLSVTDLITMASIAHPEDKKRRGFLGGIFSRKAKSSTGDSSLSSGSAGERSVSPARSDESGDGRATPRALSPASSSATLTNKVSPSRNHTGNSTRLSRPVSMISLSKTRKGPAPVPPKKGLEVNGKVPSAKKTNISLSRHSSDSSGYHEPDIRSSHTSPSSSEVGGSLEISSSAAPLQTNLTHVSSLSMSSISSSKGKRRAPPPPKSSHKKPPLAIPEEEVDSSQNVSDTSQTTNAFSTSAEITKESSISTKETENVIEFTSQSKELREESQVVETSQLNDRSITSDTNIETVAGVEKSTVFKVTSDTDIETVADVEKSTVSKSEMISDQSVKTENNSLTSDEDVCPVANIKDQPLLETNKDSANSVPNTDTTEQAKVSLSNKDTSESVKKDYMHSLDLDNSVTSSSSNVESSNVDSSMSSRNPSVVTAEVEPVNMSSVAVDSSNKQLSMCTTDNEVQTRNLSLSSETSQEYSERLNEVQRPKRQKKQRSKIPKDFISNFDKDPIYKSVSEDVASFYDDLQPLNGKLEPLEGNLHSNSEGVSPTSLDTLTADFHSPKTNHEPHTIEQLDDSLDSVNHNSERATGFGTDTEEEDAFDVKGIIKVAQLSIDDEVQKVTSEDSEKQQQSFINGDSDLPPEDVVDNHLTVYEAVNNCVPERIHSENKCSSATYIEFQEQDESSTDPSFQTLERQKRNFTSKVELSSENDYSLGLVKKPVQRSVSVTRISGEQSAPVGESQLKEEFIKRDVISELKLNLLNSSVSHTPKILTLKPKSNCSVNSDYNVVLSYNNSNASSSVVTDTPIPRTESASSYESVSSSQSFAQSKSDLPVKSSRSSTETSFESAPPPLPDSCLPISSDCDSRESRSSSVSRQSSLSDPEFLRPSRPCGPPAPVFSISTYTSRAEKISYDKKLVRSESLLSVKDLKEKPTVVEHPLDKEKDDFLFRRLSSADSRRNELYRSEEALNRNFSLSRIIPDRTRHSGETTLEGTNQFGTNSLERHPTVTDGSNKNTQDTFHSRRSTFELKSAGRFQEPIKFELGSAKDTITFGNRSSTMPNSFNMRKAKSTMDIRGGGGPADGHYPEGEVYPTGGEPGLAKEYMRLQDDFMKWQHQLLQNQHVLHSRVAPIATNPPSLNTFGAMKDMGPPTNQVPTQPRKPVEITIPIRFEDTGEIVGPMDDQRNFAKVEKPQQQYQPSQTRTNYSQPQPQFSNSTWSNNPSVQVAPWDQRPGEQRQKQQSPPVQQPNFIANGSRPYGRPQFTATQAGPITGMQTVFQSNPLQSDNQQINVSRFQEAPDPQLRFQEAPQTRFQNVPQPRFQEVPQSRFQTAPDPQMRFQEAPQLRYQDVIQPPKFQEVPQSMYQETPQMRYQQVPQSVYQKNVPQTSQEQPVQFSPKSINQPQMNYMNGSVLNNVRGPSGDRNDDNINARFTSVVTLSNDKTGDNVPHKDKVRSIVQLNNVDSDNLPSSMFRSAPVVKGFQNQPEPQVLSNEREKRSPPVCSVTPMSSRLVQQAVQQPPSSVSGGFRVSPPRFERKSLSPPKHEVSPPKHDVSSPKHEVSPPPFAGVALRHVETRVSPTRVSPPRMSPLRISPPRDLYINPSLMQNVPPPPPPPCPPSGVPAPPPPPSGMVPPPPPPPDGSMERRTSTGKRIMSANNVPQLDAREELMMAIRQFGGSGGNLRKSPHPFNS